MSQPAVQPNSRVLSAVSEQRDAMREQLSAAWQLQLDQVEEALNAGWREQIQRVLEERFAELASRLQQEFQGELAERMAAALEAAVAPIRERARRESAEEFNRAVRRLERPENESQWAAAVIDSASGFCARAVLFAVRGQSLKALRTHGVPEGTFVTELEIPLTEAPALASAAESQEPVVTEVATTELSSGIADVFETAKCTVLPVIVRDRTAALLVAEGDPLDMNGLEAVAALGGAALDRRGRVVATAPATEAGAPLALSKEERDLHLRAQRFARVRVARMSLHKWQAIQRGRTEKRIYAELKEEIDSARAAYELEFLQASPSMPDYLHLELIQRLANDDIAVLGEDYPGPLA
jgi:hypothetical protein